MITFNDNDAHDQLLEAFLAYTAANDDWRKSQTWRKYYTAGRMLRNLIQEAKARQTELHEERNRRFDTNSDVNLD